MNMKHLTLHCITAPPPLLYQGQITVAETRYTALLIQLTFGDLAVQHVLYFVAWKDERAFKDVTGCEARFTLLVSKNKTNRN